MDFSNKKDQEFFKNSKTGIQKHLLTPVTDFEEITSSATDEFYSFHKELFKTKNKRFLSKEAVGNDLEKSNKIDIFFRSLDHNLNNYPIERQIVRDRFQFYKKQGQNALQAFNELSDEPISSALIDQWGDPLTSVKPELLSHPLNLKELADEKARPVFKLGNRKKAVRILNLSKNLKTKNYKNRNR